MSFKQIIDEIVKKIRGNKAKEEPENPELKENTAGTSKTVEPEENHSTAPAGESETKQDRWRSPSIAQLRNNNWRKLHGIPLKRKVAKNKVKGMTIDKLCQILTQRNPTSAEVLAPLYLKIWMALMNGKQVITVVERKQSGQYVRIDTLNTFDCGLETMVFDCDQNGEVQNWSDLDSMRYGNITEATEGHIRMMERWMHNDSEI